MVLAWLTLAGKSMICSQVISFLKADPSRNVLFFFCDFYTPDYSVTAEVLRTLCAQMLRINEEFVSFIYDEHILKGNTPSVDVLKGIAVKLLATFDDMRIVIDGVDELGESDHRRFLNDIIFVSTANPACKLLVSSQELSSISTVMAKKSTMFIGEEDVNIQKDISAIAESALRDINARNHNFMDDATLRSSCDKILSKAEGKPWPRGTQACFDISRHVFVAAACAGLARAPAQCRGSLREDRKFA
jgi:hypothetical protein